MMQVSRICLLVAAMLCMGSATGCKSGAKVEREDTVAAPPKPKLYVGISQTAPPLIFERMGAPVGVEADFAQMLGKELGREVAFVPTYFPNLIFELRQKHIDIVMAGMSVTPERAASVAFTHPYMTTGQRAAIAQRDGERLGTKKAILNTPMRVGAEIGSTGEVFVRRSMPRATLVRYPSLRDAVRGLIRGDCQAVVYDAPALQWVARQYPDAKLTVLPDNLTEEQLAWAVRRDDQALLAAANAAIRKWRADGTLDEVLRKWLE